MLGRSTTFDNNSTIPMSIVKSTRATMQRKNLGHELLEKDLR
jgi:hypothetical protein